MVTKCALARASENGRITGCSRFICMRAGIDAWLQNIAMNPNRRILLLPVKVYEQMRAHDERLPPVPSKWFWT